MFNREYQKRATRQGIREAGGGHKLAADAALRLPWAGIFEPWRPLVLTAAAAAKTNFAAKRCKKSSQLSLFDSKLRGVQLELFAEPAPKPRESSADSDFPPLADMVNPMAEDELAAEFEKLFPL